MKRKVYYKEVKIKRAPRLSIKKYKAKLIARLNMPWAIEVGVIQSILNINNKQKFIVHMYITAPTKSGKLKTNFVTLCNRKSGAHFTDKIIKTLNYLVEDGVLNCSISQQEWKVQLALGTISLRKLIVNKEALARASIIKNN